MKRDLDLIREILLEAEKHDEPFMLRELQDSIKEDREKIYRHCVMMQDAGLISGENIEFVDSSYDFKIRKLTPTGRDYLDTVRDNGAWAKAKGVLLKCVKFAVDLFLKVFTAIFEFSK